MDKRLSKSHTIDNSGNILLAYSTCNIGDIVLCVPATKSGYIMLSCEKHGYYVAQECVGAFLVPKRKSPDQLEYPTLLVGRVSKVESRRREGASATSNGAYLGIGKNLEEDPRIKEGTGEFGFCI